VDSVHLYFMKCVWIGTLLNLNAHAVHIHYSEYYGYTFSTRFTNQIRS